MVKIVAVLSKTPGVGNHCRAEQLGLKLVKGFIVFLFLKLKIIIIIIDNFCIYSAILWCTQTDCALHSPTFSKFHKHNTYNYDEPNVQFWWTDMGGKGKKDEHNPVTTLTNSTVDCSAEMYHRI